MHVCGFSDSSPPLDLNCQNLTPLLSSGSWDTSLETLLCTVCMCQFGCGNENPQISVTVSSEHLFFVDITYWRAPVEAPMALSHGFSCQDPGVQELPHLEQAILRAGEKVRTAVLKLLLRPDTCLPFMICGLKLVMWSSLMTVGRGCMLLSKGRRA